MNLRGYVLNLINLFKKEISMISIDKIIKKINQIERDVQNCRKCNLWKKRKNPVVGEGFVYAKVMFIGEAPGYNEDLSGRPFVGKAGKIFEELLHYVGFERSNVYVTNILKCRPPKNRNPKRVEISSCTPYLNKQILTIQPKVIVTLGNFATSYIFKKFELKVAEIGKIHGIIYPIKHLAFECNILPLYHPAAVVYNPNLKRILMEDFKSIKKIL